MQPNESHSSSLSPSGDPNRTHKLPKRKEAFLNLMEFTGERLKEEFIAQGGVAPELPPGYNYTQYCLMRQLIQMSLHKSASNMSKTEKELCLKAIELMYDRCYPKLSAVDTEVAFESEQVVELAHKIVKVIGETLPEGKQRNTIVNRVATILDDLNVSQD